MPVTQPFVICFAHAHQATELIVPKMLKVLNHYLFGQRYRVDEEVGGGEVVEPNKWRFVLVLAAGLIKLVPLSYSLDNFTCKFGQLHRLGASS